MVKVRNLNNEFVVLSPDKNASVELRDDGLYERLNQNYDDFKGHELISTYSFTNDWPSWEIHPNGDEIVVLLSGEATFFLQLEDREESLILDQIGSYVIVPKGIWHTAKIRESATMLFITPGEGTENKVN